MNNTWTINHCDIIVTNAGQRANGKQAHQAHCSCGWTSIRTSSAMAHEHGANHIAA